MGADDCGITRCDEGGWDHPMMTAVQRMRSMRTLASLFTISDEFISGNRSLWTGAALIKYIRSRPLHKSNVDSEARRGLGPGRERLCPAAMLVAPLRAATSPYKKGAVVLAASVRPLARSLPRHLCARNMSST